MPKCLIAQTLDRRFDSNRAHHLKTLCRFPVVGNRSRRPSTHDVVGQDACVLQAELGTGLTAAHWSLVDSPRLRSSQQADEPANANARLPFRHFFTRRGGGRFREGPRKFSVDLGMGSIGWYSFRALDKWSTVTWAKEIVVIVFPSASTGQVRDFASEKLVGQCSLKLR